PDLIVLTLTEFADQAHRIGRAADLPLMVDADHGYGNALNVMRTVEELETAGVAGLSIEDTLLPRGYGPSGTPQLLSVEEGVGKMKAALAARRDPDLVIAARTSAAEITGIEDAVLRATAYEATGVDAMFLVGVKTRDQLEAIASRLRIPIILGGAGASLMDLEYLSAHNVRICLQGHQPFQAAVRAVYETLKALREGASPADLGMLASGDLIRKVTRADEYERWTREFLGSG
ncbi:MAG: isocitrate lyase/PEP mutase family protein, partial [Pseudomonadota bacterium]|nr:isocitrate lyase/PEP mutase family protein [Pseudomonadota bacterium]